MFWHTGWGYACSWQGVLWLELVAPHICHNDCQHPHDLILISSLHTKRWIAVRWQKKWSWMDDDHGLFKKGCYAWGPLMCKHGWVSYASRSVVWVGATSIRQGVEFVPLGSGRSRTREKWRKRSHLGRFERKFPYKGVCCSCRGLTAGMLRDAVPFQLSFYTTVHFVEWSQNLLHRILRQNIKSNNRSPERTSVSRTCSK